MKNGESSLKFGTFASTTSSVTDFSLSVFQHVQFLIYNTKIKTLIVKRYLN